MSYCRSKSATLTNMTFVSYMAFHTTEMPTHWSCYLYILASNKCFQDLNCNSHNAYFYTSSFLIYIIERKHKRTHPENLGYAFFSNWPIKILELIWRRLFSSSLNKYCSTVEDVCGRVSFWDHSVYFVLFLIFPSPALWSWNTVYQWRPRVRTLSKWKSLSRVWLFVTPMDYTVLGILQARILEWVTFPFSRGSSQPRDETQVFHIAGRFFTNWAIREALDSLSQYKVKSPQKLIDWLP